jgi:hypothetical protein
MRNLHADQIFIMANKALSKRQKMTIRLEPSQKAPRNPFALAARHRVAGPHQQSVSARRQLEKRLLQKKLAKKTGDDEES